MVSYILCYIVALGADLAISFSNGYFNQYHWYIPILIYIPLLLACFAFVFFLIFALAIPLRVKQDFADKENKFARFMIEEGFTFINIMARAKVKVIGKEKLPKDRKFLLISNHRSKFDSMIMNDKFKGYHLSFIGKRSLFKIPLVSKYIYRCCFLPIDREDLRQSLKVIQKATAYVKDDIVNVGVFPEGTRNTNKDPIPLLPFKAGCLKIAYQAQCPIIIVVTKNTEKIHKNFPFRRTKVTLKVCEIHEYEEFSKYTTSELAEILQQEMEADIKSIE